MQPNYKVQPIEKIISILSYFSMGLFGFILLLIAFFLKKNIKFFLKYNIYQSIIIAIILTIFKLAIDLILSIISLIPILDKLAAIIFWFISFKIITIFNLSFSLFEFLLFILLVYIAIGIILGRIFYIPLLTRIMNISKKLYD